MPTPGEHKTVQARILAYAEAIHLRQGYGGQVGVIKGTSNLKYPPLENIRSFRRESSGMQWKSDWLYVSRKMAGTAPIRALSGDIAAFRDTKTPFRDK